MPRIFAIFKIFSRPNNFEYFQGAASILKSYKTLYGKKRQLNIPFVTLASIPSRTNIPRFMLKLSDVYIPIPQLNLLNLQPWGRFLEISINLTNPGLR